MRYDAAWLKLLEDSHLHLIFQQFDPNTIHILQHEVQGQLEPRLQGMVSCVCMWCVKATNGKRKDKIIRTNKNAIPWSFVLGEGTYIGTPICDPGTSSLLLLLSFAADDD